jgi:hypothetical protein
MIRELRTELDRVERCIVALEMLVAPKRGRPRTRARPLGGHPRRPKEPARKARRLSS